MEFTFSDYTFSGLLSILAALYGVGYPLIIQCIGRINAQYNSTLISKKFTKEYIYKIFQWMLVVNMAFAIITPFLLHAGWNSVLFVTLQAVLLVLLVGQTFLLFNLILTYSSGEQLLKHIEGRQIDKNNLNQIFDLAVYADANHLYQLYLDCMNDVFRYFYEQQGENKSVNGQEVREPVIYDSESIAIIRRIKGFLREDDGHHYLYSQNDIVSVLFNYLSETRVSEQSRNAMRFLVNDAIGYGNRQWFMQYWRFADSYSGFKYRFIPADSVCLMIDKQEYMLHHVVVGAALVHSKRFSWLNDIFFFTHSDPEYYNLIPSSFANIVILMRKLAELSNIPLFGNRNFQFVDSLGGATDEKRVFRETLRYFSLLVIRLWSLKNRNLLHYGHIFQTPAKSILIRDEECEINLLKTLVSDVVEWYQRDVFNLIPELTKASQQDVTTFIDNYRIECENDLAQKKLYPTVSQTKYNELFEKIRQAAKAFHHGLPESQSGKSWARITKLSVQVNYSDNLETIHYSDYISIGGVSEVGTMHWINFTYQIYKGYLQAIGQMNCIKKVTISHNQLPSVLSAIQVNSNYTLIATKGIENESIHVDIPLGLTCYPSEIVIFPKDNTPYVELSPNLANNLTSIVENSPFCSNIEQFLSCNKPTFILQFLTQMTVTYNMDCKGYVWIRVNDSYNDQDSEITIDWTLDELFSNKE